MTIPHFANGRPCPALLTEPEAIEYLRLDNNGVKHPERTLRRLREQGKIAAIHVGRCVRYPLASLQTFIQQELEIDPR